ncbi:amino acid ABC transporter ATP-binding protein [Pelagicoccus sp. SDUM812002]|uniref:amino acid ABC transporter ATP-binding protein n=1 Tax=Pelagicoccus sp. SDUM812002 TaxID=3041266 RepID=UPI00281086D3|nr:amino acid ABC transporter ATP-binding protein [Pelagicoccus sp. SDUM812002]MDQ8185550.1 amino acid ABC transporter ATP-binding protein [Pelagicoccus sp. SDUM812002]
MKLSLESITKTYGAHRALKGLDLKLESSRCLTLIGPSGGGKSTTLRLIAGLEKASGGSIQVNNKPVPQTEEELRRYRKSIGVVFQSYNLFPHFDALTNIALPLEKVHGVSREESRDRAQSLLSQFKLATHGRKKPSELSGGQNQRVAIARSLAHNPDLILFDEPTSALDPEMSAQILDVIEELIQSGKDCVIVTHQMGFAKRASDYAAFISRGKVEESGKSLELFDNPQCPELAQFLERELKY